MINNFFLVQIKFGEYGFFFKLKVCYDNFIGGEWVVFVDGEYYQNLMLVIGQLLCEVVFLGK